MVDHELLIELTESYLKSLIASVADTADTDFDSSAPFTELGIDSFYVLKLIKQLEEVFGVLPKTLLFEHFNIHDLANYFSAKHQLVLVDKFAEQLQLTVDTAPIDDPQMVLETTPHSDEIKQQTAIGKPVLADSAVLMLETQIRTHPEFGQLVNQLFVEYQNDGSVSRGTRCIAPNIFLGRDRTSFFSYGRSGQVIVAYAYSGSKENFTVLAREFFEYCDANRFELSILCDEDFADISGVPFYSTPFGVLQRIIDLQAFTLNGSSMRRLRYQVSKFEKAGSGHTVEYKNGTDKQTDQAIAAVIDKWCDARAMVNPLVHMVKDEILAGQLDPQHRLFLTYLDDTLQNVVLISQMVAQESGFNGYLMDLEFYGKDMPLGGLEFAIVKMIEQLVSEGCNVLSLGGTYGCKLDAGANADPSLDKILDELRERKIFNDEGNMQFKNKFRPDNRTLYICRAQGKCNPDNIIDIIMMIADPQKMQTSDAENHTHGIASKSATGATKAALSDDAPAKAALSDDAPAKAVKAAVTTAVTSSKLNLVDDPRARLLSQHGYNPLNIADQSIEIDAKTDSWAQLQLDAITAQMSNLQQQLQQPLNVNQALQQVFGFNHFALTESGRSAEDVFYQAWPHKGTVVQNLLFPTAIYHQIDKGYVPLEVPDKALFVVDSSELFKGNIDTEALEQVLKSQAKAIAFVVVELSCNAAGGCPVSMKNLKRVKQLVQQYGSSLVLDSTRIVENAHFIISHEKGYNEVAIWTMVSDMLVLADVVLCSLAKDFCINKGGLIAANDAALIGQIQGLIDEQGCGLDIIDKKLVGLTLQNKGFIESKVIERQAAVAKIHQAMVAGNIPVAASAGAHGILFDVKQMADFKDLDHPVAAFVAWLYLQTGIRAGEHSVGMQKNSTINQMVRLAVPLGLPASQVNEIISRVCAAYSDPANIMNLAPAAGNDTMGDVHTQYVLTRVDVPSTLAVVEKFAMKSEKTAPQATMVDAAKPRPQAIKPVASTIKPENKPAPAIADKKRVLEDIAVIGMAGRYPDADNVSQLWQNLLDSKDSVTDIPPHRMAMREQNEYSRVYRGGFLTDVDKFDSLFFNISPAEAEYLDPQERLFLEVAWEAVEDAGYYPQTLLSNNGRRDVGVYVGAVWAMYQMIGVEQKYLGNNKNPNSFLWSIANRVSYWMNLTGPSLTLDTACSSSLTSVHLAVEAIHNKECFAAIAGGVNLDLHQAKIDTNSAGGALSADGLCKSFGQGGNGYVASEGVGALLLKPLSQALADKDNIHGVIKSSATNHGGRASGYTVPRPQAQAGLIQLAYDKAAIDARTIGYIEAHGTGTELGDPIEVEGLTNAFARDDVIRQSCSIGSVKSNIGHLEAAAGVVGITKVLLQMKHQQLVPSLHSSQLNEYIDFDNSPFYVQQQTQAWQAKTLDGVTYPLRAGVSSFGAGGANAHIVIEQYQTQTTVDPQNAEYIMPLSARSEAQLQQFAIRLRDFINQDIGGDNGASLSDIAYTLQVGKKSFDHRMAVVVRNKAELVARLEHYINGEKNDFVLIGHVKNADGITKTLNRKEKETFVNLLAARRNALKLAQLWTDGLLNDWQGKKDSMSGRRISLPTYPFADKRHWLADINQQDKPTRGQLMAGMHPLIDTNESTFSRQLFKKVFHQREFFMHDHLVSDIATLPGVAYLEMARKAGEIAAGRKVQKIRNILWLSPLTTSDNRSNEAYIELKPNGDVVQFEVFSEDGQGAKQIYAQGKLTYQTAQDINVAPEYINLDEIKARSELAIEGQDAYPLFKDFGLAYGPGFQVIKQVFKNDEEVLGELNIPDQRLADFSDYLLHPSLIDGAMQSGVASQLGGETGQMFVPYSIGEVEVLHPMTTRCYSYVTKPDGDSGQLSKANTLIVDENGRVLVKIKESIGVPLTDIHEKPAKAESQDNFNKLYYAHQWVAKPLNVMDIQQPNLDAIVLFDHDEKLRDLYRTRLINAGFDANQVILVKPGQQYSAGAGQTYTVDPRNGGDFNQLLTSLQSQGLSFNKIVYHWPQSAPTDVDARHQGQYIQPLLDVGVYAFISLAQAIVAHKLDGKIQLLYVYHATEQAMQPHNSAINGVAKTLQMEHSKLITKTLEINDPQPVANQLLDAILTELHLAPLDVIAVKQQQQQRYVRQLKPFDLSRESSFDSDVSLKQRGVYLVTGGTGGLGLIFAEYLAKTCQARLVLTGRSALNDAREAQLDKLREYGAEVMYVAADVADYQATEQLIEQITQRFGCLNGIIHSAGVLRDSFIRNKTAEEMAAVFAPKVFGTHHLDELTAKLPLDWFVVFSSLAGVGGNIGQADYSFANHYMDGFAEARHQLYLEGRRSGRSLSLNWSIWANGGMQLDEQTELFFKKNLGISPLASDTGLEAFVRGLDTSRPRFVVVEAVQDRLESVWELHAPDGAPAKSNNAVEALVEVAAAVTTATAAAPTATSGGVDLATLAQNVLTGVICDLLKLEPDEVDLDSILLDLGFDSIGLATFANAVNDKYGTDLTPVLFFEYPNISTVVEYLVKEQSALLKAYHQTGDQADNSVVVSAPAAQANAALTMAKPEGLSISKGWVAPSDVLPGNGSSGTNVLSMDDRFVQRPIAVVGIAGVLPQSDNLDEYWDNLKNQVNMVTEVPKDRWNWQDYWGDPVKEVNKANSKWGGFMREVDKFDPQFFRITGREAEMMDPQQRIFLETVWHAIEDSGQKVSDLAGTKTGLFMGASSRDYADLITSSQLVVDGYSASGNSQSILANRISYLLGLRGPSAPIDTACSSSSIALHRAIESIHTGSSDMAIVGGVQVILSPAGYIALSSAGMLSVDGKCKTFDASANGYVRGEGSGAIFIKPLEMAEADGNPIYAVVKATAENHGGKVSAMTVPNPVAQYELLTEAYRKARFDPSTVGYIECHGTGTSLGDPIEAKALKRAFAELYEEHNIAPPSEPHIGLTSVKTNIGHLEPAAGIAGILKVLLSIKHRKIPALLHFEQMNPYLELQDSPFYVVDKTRDWLPAKDKAGNDVPLRAGVSSFGWGGANAHCVFEEYIRPTREHIDNGEQLIVLSAKNEQRLQAYAQKLIESLAIHQPHLADMAYTLQVGRDEMEQRLAIVTDSLEDLTAQLQKFVGGKTTAVSMVTDRVPRKSTDAFDVNTVNQWLVNSQWLQIAQAWVQGQTIDFVAHYAPRQPQHKPRRVSLPGYAFGKDRYWLDLSNVPEQTTDSTTAGAIHPLVHANTSVLGQHRYGSVFSGEEFFLADHRVNLMDDEQALAQKLLPQAAYLEMGRVAALQATGQDASKNGAAVILSNIKFGPMQLFTPGQHTAISVQGSLGSGVVKFSINTAAIDEQGRQSTVQHCQGQVNFAAAEAVTDLDINQLIKQMNAAQFDRNEVIEGLNRLGLDCSGGINAIDRLYRGEHQQLLALSVPESVRSLLDDCVINPALMTTVLEVGSLLVADIGQSDERLVLAEGFERLNIIAPCQDTMYCWHRLVRGGRLTDDTLCFDVDIADAQGKVCAQIKSLTFANQVAQTPKANTIADSDSESESAPDKKALRNQFELLLAKVYPSADDAVDSDWVNEKFEKLLEQIFAGEQQ